MASSEIYIYTCFYGISIRMASKKVTFIEERNNNNAEVLIASW
jgi:hypothetical protein